MFDFRKTANDHMLFRDLKKIWFSPAFSSVFRSKYYRLVSGHIWTKLFTLWEKNSLFLLVLLLYAWNPQFLHNFWRSLLPPLHNGGATTYFLFTFRFTTMNYPITIQQRRVILGNSPVSRNIQIFYRLHYCERRRGEYIKSIH